jgi:tetratricopeptide (TPR) repeat protein
MENKYSKLFICFFAFLFFSTFCFPKNEDISQLLSDGRKLIKEQKYEEAVKVLLEAKKLDEQSPLPDIVLGMMFLQKGSLWEAEIHLKSAERINPEISALQYTLALLCEKKGEKDNAIQYWNKLLKDSKLKDVAKKHLQFLGGVK